MSTKTASVAKIIKADPWRLDVLEAVRSLGLPDWAVGAGFVRNAVWDALHGFPASCPDDIDVLYFDPDDLSQVRKNDAEQRLTAVMPEAPWSVRNQARMHIRNGDAPYRDTADAIAHWLETPTCVALRLEVDGSLSVMAPHGLDDLLHLTVRPTAEGQRKPLAYAQRLREKDWPKRWPKLDVSGPTDH